MALIDSLGAPGIAGFIAGRLSISGAAAKAVLRKQKQKGPYGFLSLDPHFGDNDRLFHNIFIY
jgi:hypothetical protein